VIIQNKTSSSISLSFLKKKTQLILRLTRIPQIDLDLSLVGNALMRSLNRKFRKKDKTTDVLSFPLHEKKEARRGGVFLGDIVIAVPRVRKQAKERGVSFERELLFLIIHGTLHLLGYDHEKSPREAKQMKKLEREILSKL